MEDNVISMMLLVYKLLDYYCSYWSWKVLKEVVS